MSCNHFTPTFLQSVKVAKPYGAKLWKVWALMLGSPVDPDWQTLMICAPLYGWHQEPPSSAPPLWVSFRQEHEDTRDVRRSHISSFETLEMPPSVLLLPVLPSGIASSTSACWFLLKQNTILYFLLTDELRKDPLTQECAQLLAIFISTSSQDLWITFGFFMSFKVKLMLTTL